MISKRDQSDDTIDLWGVLAASAQQGDKRAYGQLLQEVGCFVRNYLVNGLAQSDWAEDITQEGLISVHKALATYSPDRPFKPWLMAIVHFRRTDFLRKHYRKKGDKQSSLDHPDFIKNHVTVPSHAGEYKDVETALYDLPEKQRIVFEMLKIQGYSAKDVAIETGMSVSAVKVSAHRTMKKLKEKLG